jgi:competence protein ComEC
MLLLCLAGLRFWAADHPAWQKSELAWYNDRGEYMLTGWVSAAPDRLDGMTIYRVNVIELEDPRDPDWQHAARRVEGQAQVRMGADAGWGYGELLRFTAQPHTPSAGQDFSYRDYLAQENIHTVIYQARWVDGAGTGYGSPLRAALLRFREKARASIFAAFPQPEAGLLEGILLGVERDLPESLAQAYRDTGTAHVIAISGFNMAVLAALLLWVFGRASGPYWRR